MFDEVLRESFAVLINNIRNYALIALIIALPVSAASFGTMYWGMSDMISIQNQMMQMMRDQNPPDSQAFEKDMQDKMERLFPSIIAKMLASYVGMLIIALIGLLTQISTILITNDYFMGKPFNLGSVLNRAIKKLPGLIAIALIMGICWLIGTLLFIIPGIYLAVKFSLALPIYVTE
ncbi:MAG: hypothetical protein ACM3PP_00395, partial [Candidatus Saccharibacteria bacterium]